MIWTDRFGYGAALVALVVLGCSGTALAQQAAPKNAPAKQSKEAPKAKAAPKQAKETPRPAQPAPASQAAPAQAALGGAQPNLLGQYGDWGAYAAASGGRKVCYALAKPASQQTNPSGRPRDPAYFMISTRPAENVRDEVFIMIGYPFKPGAEATVDIGSAKYTMYTQNDGAWIKNAAEEARMIDALRKAPEVTVSGVSGRGTQSTDRYSLRGLAQALDRASQECR
jgi:invasion protein IalB